MRIFSMKKMQQDSFMLRSCDQCGLFPFKAYSTGSRINKHWLCPFMRQLRWPYVATSYDVVQMIQLPDAFASCQSKTRACMSMAATLLLYSRAAREQNDQQIVILFKLVLSIHTCLLSTCNLLGATSIKLPRYRDGTDRQVCTWLGKGIQIIKPGVVVVLKHQVHLNPMKFI